MNHIGCNYYTMSNDVLTSDITEMTRQTLNGLLLTKDALKFHDEVKMLPSNVPLTKVLLNSCSLAYSAYEARLHKEREEQRKADDKKVEHDKTTQKLKQLVEAREVGAIAWKPEQEKLQKNEASAKEDLLAGQTMLKEANEKLVSAVNQRISNKCR